LAPKRGVKQFVRPFGIHKFSSHRTNRNPINFYSTSPLLDTTLL